MAADARRAGLTSTDEGTEREARVRAAYIAAVFLVSIPVAFVNPHVAPLPLARPLLRPGLALLRPMSPSGCPPAA